MKLVVFSHKLVWKSSESLVGYATDGGFAMHMEAISSIFDETLVVVPCSPIAKYQGQVQFNGNLKILPLKNIEATGLKRKLLYPFWLFKNYFLFRKLILNYDAVHVPIPSDMGTIPMVLANKLKKPLFVRHCGNWFVQKTKAEVFWKNFMENNAGGINVMFATGGNANPPSEINPNIKWIFSTSLKKQQLSDLASSIKKFDKNNFSLITVSRQEKKKGADKIILAMPLLVAKFPNISLKIVGDGPYLNDLKELVNQLSLNNYVSFTGKVSQREVVKNMTESDIFVYPTTASEGFPKVVLEALASGKPVIANPVSVIPELLKGGAGIILENDDPNSIFESVIKLTESEEKFKQIQMEAQNTVNNFTLENWANVIQEACENAWQQKTKSNS